VKIDSDASVALATLFALSIVSISGCSQYSYDCSGLGRGDIAEYIEGNIVNHRRFVTGESVAALYKNATRAPPLDADDALRAATSIGLECGDSRIPIKCTYLGSCKITPNTFLVRTPVEISKITIMSTIDQNFDLQIDDVDIASRVDSQ